MKKFFKNTLHQLVLLILTLFALGILGPKRIYADSKLRKLTTIIQQEAKKGDFSDVRSRFEKLKKYIDANLRDYSSKVVNLIDMLFNSSEDLVYYLEKLDNRLKEIEEDHKKITQYHVILLGIISNHNSIQQTASDLEKLLGNSKIEKLVKERLRLYQLNVSLDLIKILESIESEITAEELTIILKGDASEASHIHMLAIEFKEMYILLCKYLPDGEQIAKKHLLKWKKKILVMLYHAIKEYDEQYYNASGRDKAELKVLLDELRAFRSVIASL